MKNLPERKHNRLAEYDYSQNGMYHITLCTKDHRRIFSDIICNNGNDVNNRPEIRLTPTGIIADTAINNIHGFYDNVTVEKYVIMPNHIHLLLSINTPDNGGRLVTAPTVSNIIKQLKTFITKQVGHPIWQKGFYDHIIKDDNDFENVWIYIDENPVKWENDEYY